MIDFRSELVDAERIDAGQAAHQIHVPGEFGPLRDARFLRIGNPGVEDLIISAAAEEPTDAEHHGNAGQSGSQPSPITHVGRQLRSRSAWRTAPALKPQPPAKS